MLRLDFREFGSNNTINLTKWAMIAFNRMMSFNKDNFDNNSHICGVLLEFSYNKLFTHIGQNDIRKSKICIYPISL